MKKTISIYFIFYPIFTLFFILTTCANSSADASSLAETHLTSGSENATARPFETEFKLSAGYRRDEVDWNIAGNIFGTMPNVLSELDWDDLEIFQLRFQNKTVIPNILYFRAMASYGWIYDGKVQDSDYAGDNRTFEFSRSNNSADDGDVLDASAGIGYPFRIGGRETWTITPLVGYSYHEQNLTLTDGYQTIPPLGPFGGLNSTYETEWKGPWVGLDLHFKSTEVQSFAQRIQTYLSIEYHWADYDAEAKWNLRSDFQQPRSFVHDADGHGWVLGLGLNYVLTSNWLLNINYDYQDWSTDDGTHTVFFSDGTVGFTRLNEANWTSHAFSLGIIWRF